MKPAASREGQDAVLDGVPREMSAQQNVITFFQTLPRRLNPLNASIANQVGRMVEEA